MRKMQTFKDGVLIEEVDIPDEVIHLTPEQERIAALEAELTALEAELAAIKIALGVK